MADDYIKIRNSHIETEKATEYHGRLVNYAAGKER
jgi:hypothetical protein